MPAGARVLAGAAHRSVPAPGGGTGATVRQDGAMEVVRGARLWNYSGALRLYRMTALCVWLWRVYCPGGFLPM